jgi:hypothetical protein
MKVTETFVLKPATGIKLERQRDVLHLKMLGQAYLKLVEEYSWNDCSRRCALGRTS